ncbi:hypothetical protein CEXT_238951 [Caerostris extrusa]|uniref:Uncharacterized protein n=1 Tax=Caerostris extrusa TaxID=172846 RepID=A0AAV4R8U5_CAEEX|nr:hypothetical protein CEXT_238951 [Caerostris extrusa]
MHFLQRATKVIRLICESGSCVQTQTHEGCNNSVGANLLSYIVSKVKNIKFRHSFIMFCGWMYDVGMKLRLFVYVRRGTKRLHPLPVHPGRKREESRVRTSCLFRARPRR